MFLSLFLYVNYIAHRTSQKRLAALESMGPPNTSSIPATPSSAVGTPPTTDTSSQSITPTGRKRGRPRKSPQPPSYDDFPADGTESEKE